MPEDIAKARAKGPRISVSAEAFGTFNKKEAWKPRFIDKSEAVTKAIMEKIEKSFMFSGLDDKEKQVVVDAMEEKVAQPGEVVI